MVWAGLQTNHCLQHRDSRSLIDVDLIDPGSIDGCNGPCNGVFADAFGQHFAPFREQQLGVTQASNAITGVEDDGGGNNRSEQGAAPDFVHARDQARPRLPGLLLKFHGAMQTFEQTKLGSRSRDRFLGSEFELGRHELADDNIEIVASSPSSALWSKLKKEFRRTGFVLRRSSSQQVSQNGDAVEGGTCRRRAAASRVE